MKLRLWEGPRDAPPASLTGVTSEEPVEAIPRVTSDGIDHVDTDEKDECCALLRSSPMRRLPPCRRARRRAQ